MTAGKATSPLFILYGSATGNAEHIAKDLASTYEALLLNPDATTYFPSVVCCELDQFKKKCVPTWDTEPDGQQAKHGVLIITSTTGNGDSPENASRFVRTIKRKTTKTTMFANCTFAVLALGDTNYDQFCNCGKTVDKKLEELGGVRAKPLACADEATGLEDVVEPWTMSILQDITVACQGGSVAENGDKENSVASTVVAAVKASNGVDNLARAEKTSSDGNTPPRSETPQNTTTSSPGVDIIRSLLKLKEDDPLPASNITELPTSCSLSSCRLLKQGEEAIGDDDQVGQRPRGMSQGAESVTTSSSGFHFTLNKPYASSLLEARYLTQQTSLDAAEQVCKECSNPEQSIPRAMEIYDSHFPLTGDRAERNGKRVLELTLSLPDDLTLEYSPGDSLGLVVENPPAAVTFLLDMFQKHQGIAPTQQLAIDSCHPVTLQEALTKLKDISSTIKNKRILAALSQRATCAQEKAALRLLAASSKSSSCELFTTLIEGQSMTVVDVLRLFPSCQSISAESLLGLLPAIPPRYYSVSSSPLEHKHRLTVAFSVVDYLTPSLLVGDKEVGRRRVGGVATRFLEVIASPLLINKGSVAHQLEIFPKPTTEFRMPKTLATPLILIGPGTGVAPFIGFLAHRRALLTASKEESTEAAHTVVEGTWRGGYEVDEGEIPVSERDASGLRVGAEFRQKQGDTAGRDVHLFFGCRHESHDWLYQTEMKAFEKSGIVTKLYTAFSRDGHKQYVQDLMKTSDIADLIVNGNAAVYVCGDGNSMAKDVQAAIVELLSSRVDDGAAYLEEMKSSNRFLMDIWS